MTPMEGKSLLRGAGFLLVLAVLRVGATGLMKGDIFSSPKEDELSALIQDAREVRGEEEGEPGELAPGQKLDPNRAEVADLLRLPGVGKTVAQSVLSTREAEGAFSRAEDLLEVPGIGPATLARIEPFLDFSRSPPLEMKRKRGSPAPVDLNRADAVELQTLPGIGPALGRRIVEYRSREGPFESPEALLRVQGIGPATLDRIRSRLRVRR